MGTPMILHSPAAEFGSLDVPLEWSAFVSRKGQTVTITGDRTVLKDLYLSHEGGEFVLADDLTELGRHLAARGRPLAVSNFGLSSLLHNAIVPIPHTLYRDVHLISIGDTVTVRSVDGRLEATFDFAFPWMPELSRQDGVASEERLFELLTAATERQVRDHGSEGFLMLSSGMDSPSVALALAEAGLTHIPCITYRSGPGDPEPPVAADICRRLGLSHEVIEVPTDRSKVADTLTRFFERAPLPGVDLSQIPYIFATAAVSDPRGAVLDGGGNDNYMNYPTSPGSVRKQRYRIRNRTVASAVRAVAPVDSPLNYLARSRTEATMPGRNLRMRHVRRLRSDSVDMNAYWNDVSDSVAHLDTFDMFHVVLRRHIHAGQVLLKQKLAAGAIGMGSSLPWCDDDLVEYYFHLPEADRFDRETGKNKLLLSKMLLRYLDYDSAAVGKHYFVFDGAEFISHNMDFVRAEIDASPLWDADGLQMIHKWLDRIGSRTMLHHALLTVFMISGWSNHSEFAPTGELSFVG